jgi:hypothetical protein
MPTPSQASSSPASAAARSASPASALRRRSHIRRFGLRRPAPDAVLSGAAASPFGSAFAFPPVAYVDQFAQAPAVPQPAATVPLSWTFAQDADGLPAAGITLELWFNAQSSGVLIGENFAVPMKTGTVTILVPLLYVDGSGRLRGGLFDGTSLTPPTTPTTPWSSQVSGQASGAPAFIGAANSIASAGSVVDGDWHHAALVVAPAVGAAAAQSLYLDGRLVATSTGTFSLANLAQGLQSLTALQLGGTIIPEPVTAPLPPLTYPQGFEGSMDEIRVWAGARTQSQIQLMMDQPLGPDDIAQCLIYVGVEEGNNYASASIASTPPQPVAFPVASYSYLQVVPSQVPFDPFATITSRLTGCEGYGLFLATHFSAPAMALTFAPSQPCSLKVGLRLCDVLLIAFPTQAGGDDLSGTFTLTVTEGNTQQSQTVGPFQPGATYWLTAGRTGTYRLDFSYVCEAAITIGIQFQVIPAASSTLMQSLLFFDQATSGQPSNPPLLMAYSDPNYPIVPTHVADPRQPSAQVTLPAYWPLFSDQTVFPASPSYSADDLLAAYLNLVEATPLTLASGTFADYRNLLTNGATSVDPAALSAALLATYQTKYGAPPALPPDASTYGSGPYATPQEAVYAFLYNASLMRATVGAFLDAYHALVQANINTLAAIDIAQQIATAIYTEQAFKDLLAFAQMEKGGFFANLFGQAVLWGLGAALALFAPPLGVAFELSAASISTLGTVIGAVGSAAASVGSELLGTFVASSATRISLPASLGSYGTLLDIANNVTGASTAVWDNMLTLLQDPVFRQHIYSNYGLLQALQSINAAGLAEFASATDSTIPHNPLTAGYTYATWQALVPAAFSWKLEGMQYPDPRNIATLYAPDSSASIPKVPYASMSGLFANKPGMLPQMLQTAYSLQQGNKPCGGHPAHFITMCVCVAIAPAHCPVGVINEWYLVDRTGKPIAASLAQSLFGAGSATLKLVPADPSYNFAASGGGWYFDEATPANAVTTWFDVFVNWAEAAPHGYSPISLVPDPPEVQMIVDEITVFKAPYLAAVDPPPAVDLTG